MTQNYTELVALLQDQIEDDSTEFSDYIPKAVTLVEDKLFKDLDVFLLREFEDVNTTTGSPLLTLPDNYEFGSNIAFFSDSVLIDVKKKTLDFVKDYWPNKTLTGLPKYYAVAGESQIYLTPTPNDVYTTEISFTKRPAGIDESTLENYYTRNAWTALVAGCLVEMCKFIKDYQTSQLHKAEYQEEVLKHNEVVKTKRLESGMIIANPQIGTQER